MSAAIEQIQLTAIQRFSHSVEVFCGLMENQTVLTDGVFVQRCASALASLYADVLELPDLFDETCVETQYRPFQAPQVYGEVRDRLQRLTAYSAYFDPYDPDSGTCHTLDDDLGDIYVDLRPALETYLQGTNCAMVEAVFHWKFQFSTHWGHHLVSALTALHQIMAENLLASDERPD